MSRFAWTAVDGSGREVAGTVDAADEPSAAADVRRRGLYLTSVTAGAAAETKRDAAFRAGLFARLVPIGGRDLAFLFRQIALMLRAGLTVTQALEVARAQAGKRRLAQAVDETLGLVRGGEPLSRAMARRPDVFPDVVTALIVPAEASGELDQVLGRLAAHLERLADVRAGILTSLFYPMIVTCAALGVGAFLVTRVLPRFAKFFQQRGIALPPMARFLLDLASFLETNGTAVTIALVVVLSSILVLVRSARGRAAIDRFALVLPVFGKLIVTAAMAQSGRTLAMLLRSGVPLLDSLRVAARAIGNSALRGRMDAAAEMVLRGRGLAQSLVETRAVPPLVSRVVAVGEETGALEDVLDEVGTHYDRDLETRLKRMTALFEPALVIVVGTMVGFIYYTFFQAMFHLAEKLH